MSLVDRYRRQFAWRSWPTILDALPPLEGRTVVDLGCGVGDVSAELVARGARIIGIDANEELIAAARARELPHAEFRQADLRHVAGDAGILADGLWCSFTAAYFPALDAALPQWKPMLRRGGWLALTEIDDLLGHEPLDSRVAAILEGYAREALHAGRYDFHMGRKLAGYASRAGFDVRRIFDVPDRELSFEGPADAEVLAAWRARLDGMPLLHALAGPAFDAVRDDFLACLARSDHRSRARVVCCIAFEERV